MDFSCRMNAAETVETFFDGGAVLVHLPSHADQRGQLIPLELSQFFAPVRTFLVHGVPEGAERGRHAHRTTRQLMICLVGCVAVELRLAGETVQVLLDRPTKALLVEPGVWSSQTYRNGAQLFVLASEPFDPDDYVNETP